MIHYHGTPITPRAKLLELAGRHFCVSFAAPGDIKVCHEIGQSVMIDNGAFSMWRTGKPTDWPAYYEWVRPWLDYPTTWAVIPDVIDGTEEANDDLIDQWPFDDRGAPVWHLHESLDRLNLLRAEWPLVCIGSSGQYAQLGTPAWNRRMAEAMEICCDRSGVALTRLHMLRGLDLADGPYPFYSADSTNIARNHAGNHTRATPARSPRAMADEIDARQPAPRWQRNPDQMELAA